MLGYIMLIYIILFTLFIFVLKLIDWPILKKIKSSVDFNTAVRYRKLLLRNRKVAFFSRSTLSRHTTSLLGCSSAVFPIGFTVAIPSGWR